MTERFWVPSGVSVSGPLPPNDGQAWRELVPLADLQAAQEERDDMEKRINQDFRRLVERRAEVEALEARFESLAEELERRAEGDNPNYPDPIWLEAASLVRQAPHKQEVEGG